MTMNKIGAATLALWVLANGAAQAQVAYIPPGGDRPRFGGEFSLSEVGPVAGYWPTQCRTWSIRAQAHRTGPLAAPPVDAVLKRFISGLIANQPNFDDLSPQMARAVRLNLPTYWASFNRMGQASAAKHIDTESNGEALYVLDQAGGRTHWNLTLDPAGKITSAFMCQGTGL